MILIIYMHCGFCVSIRLIIHFLRFLSNLHVFKIILDMFVPVFIWILICFVMLALVGYTEHCQSYEQYFSLDFAFTF